VSYLDRDFRIAQVTGAQPRGDQRFDVRRGAAADVEALHIGHRDIARTIHQIIGREIRLAGHADGQPVARAHAIAGGIFIGCGLALGTVRIDGATAVAGGKLGDAGHGKLAFLNVAMDRDASAAGGRRDVLPGFRAAAQCGSGGEKDNKTHTHRTASI
jgi:hypothetical protein